MCRFYKYLCSSPYEPSYYSHFILGDTKVQSCYNTWLGSHDVEVAENRFELQALISSLGPSLPTCVALGSSY